MTERLYYTDTYLRSFDARIVSVQPRGDQFAIILDRSAFYPTGGGQLHDLGTMGDVNVVNVLDEDSETVHITDRAPSATDVHCEIDWARRWDLAQQHTGQHIISQAFYQLFKAETISVHMTTDNCTLDLPRHLTAEQHSAAEELANEIVQQNRSVRATFVSDDELARIPLRKAPAAKHTKIRIVEIAEFDWSACGGTHVRATGEVGFIKLIRAEKRGNEQRIEFMCGMRALRDYRWKNQSIVSLAAQFSVKDSDLAGKVQSLTDENKDLRKQLNAARAALLGSEAERLWASANGHGVMRLIQQVFEGRTLDEVRQLALLLKAKPTTTILFAVAGDKPNLIFARSDDMPHDMGKLLRDVATQFGGRGGGQPMLAQGGVASGSDLAQVLQAAVVKIQK
jgi:alanyl-tRNA synthetase